MPCAALTHIKHGTSRLLQNCPLLHLEKEKVMVVQDTLLLGLHQEIALDCLINKYVTFGWTHCGCTSQQSQEIINVLPSE